MKKLFIASVALLATQAAHSGVCSESSYMGAALALGQQQDSTCFVHATTEVSAGPTGELHKVYLKCSKIGYKVVNVRLRIDAATQKCIATSISFGKL